MYRAYQANADLIEPIRFAGRHWFGPLISAFPALRDQPLGRVAAATAELLGLGLTHERPDYGIRDVEVDGRTIPVLEEVLVDEPFAALLRFRRPDAERLPRVLVAAPMSGHFATLLRGTIRTLLRDHDVYVTDWKNARDIPLDAGRFDLDAYVMTLVRFLEALGPGSHLLAVCQPTVPALASVAWMAMHDHPMQPASLVLMAGPIDARVNPTKVNELATSRDLAWFEQQMITTVPWPFAGAGRRVYPGFMQLAAFMSMNAGRHVTSLAGLFDARVAGDDGKADTTREFYEEYFAVMDMAAEFYLDTIGKVFQTWDLARGELRIAGERIDPSAIRRTSLMTVEGERDDICSVGQTVAAQELCSRVRPYRRSHHVQAGVGHYGVFSGRRWETSIYPMVREVIHTGAGT